MASTVPQRPRRAARLPRDLGIDDQPHLLGGGENYGGGTAPGRR
ncbi:hypothetical protein [Streptomyces zingiberis]|nr:hypothetical protein [Streptomyces zingiberis]